MRKWILLSFASMSLASCVTSKKYNELDALSDKYLSEKRRCEDDLEDCNGKLEDCLKSKTALEKDKANLEQKVSELELSGKQLKSELEKYKEMNQALNEAKSALLNEASNNQNKLMQELKDKEKALDKISAEQKEMDALLKARQAEMDLLQADLEEKSKKIAELEARLAAKDEALSKLKETIKAALSGFSSDEIQVQEKDGKLYVSLSEKLLFKSGSFTVDEKGKEALISLGKVLQTQEDFDILVEGHTDNVPYSGTGQLLDNWDLSVKRATSVVRILTIQGGLSQEKIAASGRGEFVPVSENETKEGKAKNRRTEIVLSPKLDKILNLLNKE
ncbi:MAG: OmpA family protein [Chitinophagales bacterium]|nr:OmpA family protein [Chitinophagales bacterium]